MPGVSPRDNPVYLVSNLVYRLVASIRTIQQFVQLQGLALACAMGRGCQDIGSRGQKVIIVFFYPATPLIVGHVGIPANGRDGLIARLDRVREISHAFGYGVGDDMDYLLAKYAKHSG